MTAVAERVETPMAARNTSRITLDVPESAHRSLTAARFADGVTIADRLRALIALWEEDPGLAERTTDRARQIAKERSET
jgi:hypothetical protein